MTRVKIEQPDLGQHVKIYADGKEITGANRVLYEASAGEVPEVDVTVIPEAADIECLASLHLHVDIDDIKDAVSCFRLEMSLDTEFRQSVIASARSAIDERLLDDETSSDELATAIIDRIFGMERLCSA